MSQTETTTSFLLLQFSRNFDYTKLIQLGKIHFEQELNYVELHAHALRNYIESFLITMLVAQLMYVVQTDRSVSSINPRESDFSETSCG